MGEVFIGLLLVLNQQVVVENRIQVSTMDQIVGIKSQNSYLVCSGMVSFAGKRIEIRGFTGPKALKFLIISEYFRR
jgi:hypothetical protein